MAKGKQWAYKDGAWRDINANREPRPGEIVVERIDERRLKVGNKVVDLPTPDLPDWSEMVHKHSIVKFNGKGENSQLAEIAVFYARIEEEYEANKDNWHLVYNQQERKP